MVLGKGSFLLEESKSDPGFLMSKEKIPHLRE